ncbi:MAG: MOSC domain-containing protein [Thermoleophilaceae bacterium]
MTGTVEQIAVAAEESGLPGTVDEVEVRDRGMVGDRYADARDITLIEAEALEAFTDETGIELTHEESRRQVLTRGVRLNDLVGKSFTVGEVECVGRELCEPCSHLQSLTRDGVLRGMVHRAGLNADIVKPGRIAVGDQVAGLG